MKSLLESAWEIIGYLSSLRQVRTCRLYGSMAEDRWDQYSDIDIEVDVSGTDNSVFMTRLPEIMASRYPVIFSDYAPSHMPQSYIVSIAFDETNPFCIVDFKCLATPHYTTIGKNDIQLDKLEHTIKVWVANCKHYLRGLDCRSDMTKMAGRIFDDQEVPAMTELEVLSATLDWLQANCEVKHKQYLANCRRVIDGPVI